MAERPWPLDQLRANFLYQLTVAAQERRAQAANAMQHSDEFRATAQYAIENDLGGSAISNLHESVRLAITAQATADGYRFRDTAGSHAAVDDYALAAGLVTRKQWAQLDTLRDMRNANNYPADIAVQPNSRELAEIAGLVDAVRNAVAAKVNPPRRIPPPPTRPA